MSKLFFDEQPIVISRELAKIVGLNEAIVLQQIHYWIEINKKADINFHEGRYWTYNSIRAWHEDNFNFWHYDTVKRTFSKLEKMGLLLTDNFNKDPRDKTKWYSINLEAVQALKNPISAKCTNEEKKLEVSKNPISAKCTNAPMQNASTHKGKMHQPLPEITTEITTEITKVSQSVIEEEPKKEEKPIRQTDRPAENMKEIFKVIEDRLDIHGINSAYPHEQRLIQEITLNIFDMYCSDYTTVDGQRKPKELVRSAIMRLTYFHIEELIRKYKNLSTLKRINNPKAYMQTMIYNIAFENELAITNEVKYNLGY